MFICTVLRRSKYATVVVVSHSDACHPRWRSTRDGLIGSAFVTSIVAYIFDVAMVWTHIYYHKGKKIQDRIT